jgi:hypothetical protein
MALLSRERGSRLEWAVVAAAVAMFAPSLGYSLTFDDLGTVVEHPGVQGMSVRDVLLRGFWGHHFGDPEAVPTYRPVVTLTYWLDRHLGRGAPWVFHATNLLWYALLLFALFRLLRTWNIVAPRARLLVVSCFAALAIHADVVPSVTGRTEIMAALFSILALDFALRDNVRWFVPVALLAMFSKESALPFVAVIPLVVRKRTIAFAAAASVASVLAFRFGVGLPFRAAMTGAEADNVLLTRGFVARLPGVFDVLTRYLEHTLTGVELSPDYHYASVVPSSTMFAVRPAIGVVATVLAVLYLRREVLLLFAGSYLVVSSFLMPASAVLADRVFFLPSFFLVLALAIAAERRARVAVPVAVAFAVVQSILAIALSRIWRNERTLAMHVVATYPVNARGRHMRAHIAYLDGDVATTAWELVVESAIYNAYPRALERDAIPASWDARDDRFALLRDLLGPAAYSAAIARGRVRAHLGGYRDASAFIAELR